MTTHAGCIDYIYRYMYVKIGKTQNDHHMEMFVATWLEIDIL